MDKKQKLKMQDLLFYSIFVGATVILLFEMITMFNRFTQPQVTQEKMPGRFICMKDQQISVEIVGVQSVRYNNNGWLLNPGGLYYKQAPGELCYDHVMPDAVK